MCEHLLGEDQVQLFGGHPVFAMMLSEMQSPNHHCVDVYACVGCDGPF